MRDEDGKIIYDEHEHPKTRTERGRDIRIKREGNVVLAYTRSSHLMLDCDLKREDEVKEFARNYTLKHGLGSVGIWRTSSSSQVDLYGNRSGNFASIFGAIISWDEIK
jgi:uncharacterized protein YfaP (DUF2135 family)